MTSRLVHHPRVGSYVGYEWVVCFQPFVTVFGRLTRNPRDPEMNQQ